MRAVLRTCGLDDVPELGRASPAGGGAGQPTALALGEDDRRAGGRLSEPASARAAPGGHEHASEQRWHCHFQRHPLRPGPYGPQNQDGR